MYNTGPLQALTIGDYGLPYSRLLNSNCTEFQVPITDCPFCKNTSLYLYRDHNPATNGIWHICYNCHFVGDNIAFCCKLENKKPFNILRKLYSTDKRTEEVATTYEQELILRKNTFEMWKSSKLSTPYNTSEVEFLYDELDLLVPPEREWTDRLGMLVGGQSLLNITPSSNHQAARTLFLAHRKIEDYAISIPFRDFPGKLTGFLLMYVNKRQVKTWFYRAPRKRLAMTKKDIDCADIGIGLSENVNVESDFDNTVFVIMEPILALQLLDRHFIDNSLPLPVVTAYTYTTDTYLNYRPHKNTFQQLSNKKIIYWSKDHTSARYLADLSGQKASDIQEPMSVRWPMDWLNKLQKTAK